MLKLTITLSITAPAGTPDTARLFVIPVVLASGILILNTPELAVIVPASGPEVAVKLCEVPLHTAAGEAGLIVIVPGCELTVTDIAAEAALVHPVPVSVTLRV